MYKDEVIRRTIAQLQYAIDSGDLVKLDICDYYKCDECCLNKASFCKSYGESGIYVLSQALIKEAIIHLQKELLDV